VSDLRAAETLAAAIGLRVGLQIQEAMANPIACVRNSPPRRCPTRNPTRLAAPIRARRTMNDERTQHQIAALLSADDRLEPSRLSAIAATVGAHERTVPPERRTVPTPPPGRSVLSDERASGPAHTGRPPGRATTAPPSPARTTATTEVSGRAPTRSRCSCGSSKPGGRSGRGRTPASRHRAALCLAGLAPPPRNLLEPPMRTSMCWRGREMIGMRGRYGARSTVR
jgi:hypothetical protein